MKQLLWIGVMIMAIFAGLITPTNVTAQGGCPAAPLGNSEAVRLLKQTAQKTIPLSEAIVETRSDVAQGVIFEQKVTVHLSSSERAIVASANFGRLCGDDVIEITTQPLNKTLRIDGRSGGQIVGRPAVDISEMLVAGQNRITTRLIDIQPDAASASPVVLWVLPASPPLPAFMQVVNRASPDYRLQTSIDHCRPVEETTEQLADGISLVTHTSGSRPAACAQVMVVEATPRPTASPTSTLVLTVKPVEKGPEEALVAQPDEATPISEEVEPFPRLFWISMGLAFIAIGGVVWWLIRQSQASVPGGMDIYKKGVFLFSVVLSDIKQRIIRVGSGPVEIVLDDADVPVVAARIIPQRDPQGQRQAIWELLDPDMREVIERQTLENDDVLYIGDYKLIYRHYQAELSFFEGSLANVSQ